MWAQPSTAREQPRIGLALSGGGARGIAHVGILRAMEESGVPIDSIAGTSIGAIIGALYASGRSASELAEIVRSLDWREVFQGAPERPLVPLSYRLDERTPVLRVPFEFWRLRLPRASQSDYRISRLLTRYLAPASHAAGGEFDRLPVPFRAVATDLATGARVVLARGALDRAVRASMSTPVLLPPVRMGGAQLVDGGLSDNLPTGVAREMGAAVVIAVDVSSPPRAPESYETAIGVGGQVVEVLARKRGEAFFQEADLTIRPRLEGFTWNDYTRFEELMARGYEAGRAAVEAMRALAGQRRRVAVTPATGEGPEGRQIEEVVVEGLRHVRPRLVLRTFGLRAGDALVLEEALRGLDAVYATRLFTSSWVEFRRGVSSGVVVALHLEEAPRRRLEAGAAYNESDHVKGFLRVRDRNLLGWGERLEIEGFAGDEAKGVEGSFMGERLLGSAAGYLLQARAVEDEPRFYRAGDDLGRAGFDREELAGALQRQLGPSVLVRLGLAAGRARVRARSSLPFEPRDDALRMLRGAAVWDRLDDPHLPASGARLELTADRSLRGLGADLAYSRLRARAHLAVRVAKASVVEARALLAVSDGAVPPYDLFRVGGPRELPGFRRDELWGEQAAALALAHSLNVARGVRLVARAGAGNVWESRRAISLRGLPYGAGAGLVVPTRVGPLSVEWARRKGGRSAVYFSIGFE